MKKLDFFKFEREGVDFPFYRDNPKLNIKKWVLLSISIIIPLILIFLPHAIGGRFEGLLYFLIPFISFGIVTTWKYDLICKKFQKNDFKLIIILVVLQLIFSISINFILKYIFNIQGQPNIIFSELNTLVTWIIIPIQIFGEELLKIVPFLIFLTIFYKITDNRKISIVISTILVLIIFGIMHLPVYKNLVSVLLLQGLASIFTMFGYLKTKNILVSFLIHLIFDLIPIIIGILFIH